MQALRAVDPREEYSAEGPGHSLSRRPLRLLHCSLAAADYPGRRYTQLFQQARYPVRRCNDSIRVVEEFTDAFMSQLHELTHSHRCRDR